MSSRCEFINSLASTIVIVGRKAETAIVEAEGFLVRAEELKGIKFPDFQVADFAFYLFCLSITDEEQNKNDWAWFYHNRHFLVTIYNDFLDPQVRYKRLQRVARFYDDYLVFHAEMSERGCPKSVEEAKSRLGDISIIRRFLRLYCYHMC